MASGEVVAVDIQIIRQTEGGEIVNRPEIHFASNHSTGNVFRIMGAVRDALRKQRRISEWNDLYQEVQNCGSYEEALRLMNEHVHLIDDDGRYKL